VPQLFYTQTLKSAPVSFGLGVYAPFGGSMNWPNDISFNTVATQGKLTYLTANPVVAVKLAPSLSLGGGVMVNYVNMDLEQVISYPTRDPNFFRFKGDGWSVGYNLGVRWQPIDQISIGATFRSSATVNLNGHTEFQYPPATPYTSLPAQADFTFPLTAVVGLSYRPTPKWNLEFDATYTDWSSFGNTTIYQQGSAPFGFPQNTPVNLDWQASWMYEFGVTRYFDNGWHVSAGYVYNQTSVPDAYYTPLAADLDRHFFSVGTGYKGKRFDCDIAYQFGYGPTHTVTGSTPPIVFSNFGSPILHPADGNYDFISQAVLVTVGMHF
jgi:long-chain fatty acid transport protein